jgi:hypothetical protein
MMGLRGVLPQDGLQVEMVMVTAIIMVVDVDLLLMVLPQLLQLLLTTMKV